MLAVSKIRISHLLIQLDWSGQDWEQIFNKSESLGGAFSPSRHTEMSLKKAKKWRRVTTTKVARISSIKQSSQIQSVLRWEIVHRFGLKYTQKLAKLCNSIERV